MDTIILTGDKVKDAKMLLNKVESLMSNYFESELEQLPRPLPEASEHLIFLSNNLDHAKQTIDELDASLKEGK